VLDVGEPDQLRTRGDWSLFAFYEYLGQEAAISSFTWSDFGTGATNVAIKPNQSGFDLTADTDWTTPTLQ